MRKKIKMIIVLFFITQAGVSPSTVNQDENIFNAKKYFIEEEIYQKAFTPELFREAMFYAGIMYQDIAYRQAILETGNFTSQIFKEGNNLFGFRLAKYRPSPGIGEINYHAKYWHWYDSVRDYAMWQQWNLARGHILNEYFTFLEEIRYAVDPLYISKLQNLEII